MADVTTQQKTSHPAPARRWLAWGLIASVALLAGFQARALVGSHATAGSAHEPDDPPPKEDDEAASRPAKPDPADGEEEAEAEGEEEPTLYVDKPLHLDQVPAAATNAAGQKPMAPAGVDLWRRATLVDGRYQAKLADGRMTHLSVNPKLQRTLQTLLSSYKPMAGAVVALDPRTGQILAMAEYSKDGNAKDLATRPLYPAASVFKIITGAALLDAGISHDDETCYHGGMHGLVGKLLQDRPRVDRRCLSLSMALAKSANVVFGKLAVRHLDAGALRKEAEKLLFNRPIPGYAQYRSPVPGLYMCGSSTHPGGGVMGAPGANAARAVLRDFGRTPTV